MKTIALAMACAAGLFAQPAPSANPMADEVKGSYNTIKNNLIKAAEKMPENGYAFKPSHDVRSFGQLVGHVADAGYLFCGGALPEASRKPAPQAEKNLTTKDQLVAALKESFAYCDAAYNGLTDASMTSAVKMFGRDRKLVSVMWTNVSHDNEHYGNMVTYMRIRGFVPPSSEGR